MSNPPTLGCLALSPPQPISRLVALADCARRVALSRFRGEPAPTVLTGKDAAGTPLGKQHAHAAFLPQPDGDGLIRRLFIHAPMGFGPDSLQALASLRVLHSKVLGHEVKLALLRVGVTEHLALEVPGLGPARCWLCATPLVLPRHPMRRGGVWMDAPEAQVRQAWRLRTGLGPSG